VRQCKCHDFLAYFQFNCIGKCTTGWLNVLHAVASDGQREEAKLYIERYIMSRIYIQAMFPNGDADVLRDQ